MNIPMWHQPECAADGFQGNTHRWSCCTTSKVNSIVCKVARHCSLKNLHIHKALIDAESRIKHASKHICNATNLSSDSAVVMWVEHKPLVLRFATGNPSHLTPVLVVNLNAVAVVYWSRNSDFRRLHRRPSSRWMELTRLWFRRLNRTWTSWRPDLLRRSSRSSGGRRNDPFGRDKWLEW